MTDFDLDAFLPYQLAVAASRVSRKFGEMYRARYGLSVAEWRILAHLSQTDALSVRDLHQRADLEKSKASRAAARLETAGLVEKRASTGDKRLIALSLTADGRALIDELTPLARRFEDRVLAHLPEEQRDALRAALLTLAEKA